MGTEVKDETKALQRQPKAPLTMGERGFNFDFENAQRFALALIDAGMVPRGISKPGHVVGLIQAGKELGLPPMMALANLTFTNGRTGIMGDAAKALIRKAGVLEPETDFDETYSGKEFTAEWTAKVTAHRLGQPKPFVSTFSLSDAVNAKLARINDGVVQSWTRDGWDVKGPWSLYTKRMLKYRALGFLCRDHFSDVLLGCVVTEELRDYPDSTATRSAPPSEPDPLLIAATATNVTSDVVESEIVDEIVAYDDEPPLIAREADELESAILSRNTIVGVSKVWNAATETLMDLDAQMPERAAQLREVFRGRMAELGAKP